MQPRHQRYEVEEQGPHWMVTSPRRCSASSSGPRTPLSPTSATRTMHLLPNPHAHRTSYRASRSGKEDLHLLQLPRFHPANYASPDATTTQMNNRARALPIGRLPLSPPQRQSLGHNAYQKRQQHHRQLVLHAARSCGLVNSSNKPETPKAPLILPRGSPGPATPLALEGESDYMIVGANDRWGVESPREIVDRAIRKETERRRRVRSIPGSPAASPNPSRGSCSP